MSEAVAAFPRERVLTLRPIGHVESAGSRDARESGGREAGTRIILDPALSAAYAALSPDRRILVVYPLHRSPPEPLQRHPHGDKLLPRRGGPASGTPEFPSSLGVAEVRILGIDGNVLHVDGLDAADGSPVLDLKPV